MNYGVVVVRFVAGCALAGTLTATHLDAQSRPSIYVPATMNSTALPGLSSADIGAYLAGLARKAAPCATSRVVSQSDVEAFISFDRMKRLLTASDVSSMSDIGGALGARYILGSRLEYAGATYVLSVSLIDTRNEGVVARSGGDARDPDGVLDLVERTVDKLNLLDLLCYWRGTITIQVQWTRDTVEASDESGAPMVLGGPPVINQSRSREVTQRIETWIIEKTGRTRTDAKGTAQIESSFLTEHQWQASGILCVNGTAERYPANRQGHTRSEIAYSGGGALERAEVEVDVSESGDYHIGVRAASISVTGTSNWEQSEGDDCYPTETQTHSQPGEPQDFDLPWGEITASGYKKGDLTLANSQSFALLDVKYTVKWDLKRN